jgi:hypothetical protein
VKLPNLSEGGESVLCIYHTKVETNLRCSKCEKPICPRCMVYTPVGARCPECAAVKRVPMYDVSSTLYLRALGAGLGIAIVAGFIWSFVGNFGFFGFFIAMGLGYVIGEGISRSVRYKRGRGLQLIAGISVVVAVLMRGLAPVLLQAPAALLDGPTLLQIGQHLLIGTVSNIFGLITIGIAVFIAVRRLQ